MTHLNISTIVYVIISLCVIAVLIYFLVDCRKKCESFCICRGMDSKVCPNMELLHKEYDDGKLTEFTNFGEQPRQWQEMEWNKCTPYHRPVRVVVVEF